MSQSYLEKSQHTLATEPPSYKQYATGWGFRLGLLAALVSILIWASWLVSMRAGMTNPLTAFDLGVLRFSPPAL